MPDMPTIMVMLAFFIGGAVQGATGFGFGLTALAILGATTEFRSASAILVIAGLCINAVICYRFYKELKMDGTKLFLISTLLAVPCGVYFLGSANLAYLRYALAIILILSGVRGFIPNLFRIKQMSSTSYVFSLVMGLFTGILTGSFGTGGPPAVAFVTNQNFQHHRAIATIQLSLAIGGLIRLFSLLYFGVLNQNLLASAAFGATSAIAGCLLGMALLAIITEALSRQIMSIALFGFGLLYILK